MSNRKEYIYEMVRTTLKKRSLNEFLDPVRAFEYGREFGASSPDPAIIDVKIYDLEKYITPSRGGKPPRINPNSPEGRNIRKRINLYRAGARRRHGWARRAGAIGQQGYEGGLGMAKSAISGTVSRAAELALGKGTQSVGIVPLGIATTEEPRQISQINR